MELSVDRLLCEANALCVGFAPDVFDLDEDDELVLSTSNPTGEQVERVSRAVAACPKNALLMRS